MNTKIPFTDSVLGGRNRQASTVLSSGMRLNDDKNKENIPRRKEVGH